MLNRNSGLCLDWFPRELYAKSWESLAKGDRGGENDQLGTHDGRFGILFGRPANESNLKDSFDQSIEAVHSVNVCSTG
jgi:hypothetical protein